MKPYLTFAIVLTMAVGCAEPAKKSTADFKENVPAKALAPVEKTPPSFTQQIVFDRNSAAITAKDKMRLDELLKKARQSGKIEDVKVVAWADARYPDKKESKLNKVERHLADARARSVMIYLKSRTKGIPSQHYNMAERPTVLQELLATPDARMKASLQSAGLARTDDDPRGGKNASKALVLLIVKQ